MPVVLYTLYRLALFGVFLGLLWWLGMRSWLAPVVAALLAWMTSYAALRGPREAAVAWIAAREEARARAGGRGRTHAEQDADVEDAAVDAAGATTAHPTPEEPAAATDPTATPGTTTEPAPGAAPTRDGGKPTA